MADNLSEHLSQISTKWTKMEEIMEGQGPAALAEYLASLYYDALAVKLQRRCTNLDGLQAFETASDIIYEFIKNDYRLLKKLRRDRGHLRGLFMKILRSHLSKRGAKKREEMLVEETLEDFEPWVDLSLDLDEALQKLKEEEPWFYDPFYLHYIENRSGKEIAAILDLDEAVVWHRIYSAKDFIRKSLKGYK